MIEASKEKDIGQLWHKRLGHCGNQKLSELVKHKKVPFTAEDLKCREKNCVSCIVGKFRRMTRGISESEHEPATVFGLDLCGPISPPSMDGKRYCMGLYGMGDGA